jgi:hypothetical protein
MKISEMLLENAKIKIRILPHKNNSPNCAPCHSIIRLLGMNLIKGEKVVDK